MNLSAYLEKTTESRSAFARRLEVHPSYVSMLCDGSFWPSRRLMLRILEATHGRVTPNDLLGVDVSAYRVKTPTPNRSRRNATDGQGRRKRQG